MMKQLSQNLALFTLIFLLPNFTSCNIWDNVYSKYDIEDLNNSKSFVAEYKLKQFRFLNSALRVNYAGLKQKIQLEFFTRRTIFQKKERSLFKLYIDFNKLEGQISSSEGSFCQRQKIPTAFKLDILNLQSFWLFAAFYEGKELEKDVYSFKIDEITSLGNFIAPKIKFYLGETKIVENIDVELVKEKLNFLKEKFEVKNENFDFFAPQANCESMNKPDLKNGMGNNSGIFSELLKRMIGKNVNKAFPNSDGTEKAVTRTQKRNSKEENGMNYKKDKSIKDQNTKIEKKIAGDK